MLFDSRVIRGVQDEELRGCHRGNYGNLRIGIGGEGYTFAGESFPRHGPSPPGGHRPGTNDTNEIPVLRAEDIQVKQGKNVLKVEQLIPARDDNAAFQLFVVIDDTCDSPIGNNLNDLRDFINAQPQSTSVGVVYMYH